MGWNCQGIGSPETLQRLGEIKCTLNPYIFFLSETKNPPETVLSKIQELQYEFHHIIPPTSPGAGGLTLLWKHSVKLDVLNATNNLVDTSIDFKGKLFYASFIYSDTNRANRKLFWDELIRMNESRDAAWFVTGDFNDIIGNDEKTGGPARPEG